MAPADTKSLIRDHSTVAPSLPRAESPQTWARSDLDIQSWGDPGYTNTVSSTPIVAAANANWESAREREGFYLYLAWVEIGHSKP